MTASHAYAGPVLRCAGEIDFHTAPRLDGELHRALAVRPAPAIVLVDLQDVLFMDSTGLNSLLGARIEADLQGTLLVLARPRDQVLRLLQITGVGTLFALDTAPPRPR